MSDHAHGSIHTALAKALVEIERLEHERDAYEMSYRTACLAVERLCNMYVVADEWCGDYRKERLIKAVDRHLQLARSEILAVPRQGVEPTEVCEHLAGDVCTKEGGCECYG